MLALTLITGILDSVLAAQQQTYEAEGVYILGSTDTMFKAKIGALQEAKRLALERAGTYLESVTWVVDGQLTKDEIARIASGVIKLEKIINEETKLNNGVVLLVIRANFIIDNEDLQKKVEDLQKSGKQQEQLPITVEPNKAKVISKGAPKVGSIILFDNYKWLVLKVQDGKALILSEKIIVKRQYHHSQVDITWAECDLRNYLNNNFYNSFSSPDRERIAQTPISTNNNPWYGRKGGDTVNDRIFLLSIEEVVEYFGNSGQLKNKPQGAYRINDQYNSARIATDKDGTASWWWLRSPGFHGYTTARVDSDGNLDIPGDVNYGNGGVRPALWLNL